ncbi:hypothetical protein IscW_ISCW023772 [Ixodes scapularis]|uniref:Methyltransferase domain-containing protein n=1 Tax=Ixodes scapularis TaxID=6945 RepID=B7QMC3_IXOSC|nr:hypothetical protein IscW_ISCW023772 [Ixodes scapularis]|eukprot:XP_002416328.1 hypothetical protein IscW_ISCW023772 [Ixodes scapularis]
MANPSIAEAREEPQPAVTFLPEVYVKANDLQRKTNIRTLERFGINFKSRPSADQQFIDIGCGTGDFTRQELLQRCQPCRRIVATDIGESMVRYANENFAHPQIEYQVHDISIDVSGLLKKYGPKPNSDGKKHVLQARRPKSDALPFPSYRAEW